MYSCIYVHICNNDNDDSCYNNDNNSNAINNTSHNSHNDADGCQLVSLCVHKTMSYVNVMIYDMAYLCMPIMSRCYTYVALLFLYVIRYYASPPAIYMYTYIYIYIYTYI